MRILRSALPVAVVVGACAYLGGAFGLRVGTNGNLIEIAPIQGQIDRVQVATRLVEKRFADEVDWDRAMYEGAIPAMLGTLDPHSTFFPTEQFARVRERDRARYAGVGIQLVQFGGRAVVDFPFPKTPAFRAGILPGDTIEQVDGRPVNELQLSEVANQVKGPPGTSVSLSVSRLGSDDWIEVDLVRNVIPRPTVPVRILFDDGTAYLRVTSFADETDEELGEALRQMSHRGMKGLLLDLRDNKGGLLSTGVNIASHFLEAGQTVVSHRGRSSPERLYRGSGSHPSTNVPMVVLVNCRSASASEIVAAALQDHDRALIAGTNTFGKGLVQSVFALPESTGMVLTTARYYSPSGRLIQRPYDRLSPSEYFDEPCSEQFRPSKATVRLTDQGRKVYELGGIAPDVRISTPTATYLQRFTRQLRVVERYSAKLRSQGGTLLRGETPSPEMVDQLLWVLRGQGIRPRPQTRSQDRQYLMRSLARHLHTAFFDYDEGRRIEATYDPVVLQARSLLGEAALLQAGKWRDIS